MLNGIRRHLLHWARVPADPEPPAGAPGSVQVFRAGQNDYKVRLLKWSFAQLSALIGIIFSFGFLNHVEQGVIETQATAQQASQSQAVQTPNIEPLQTQAPSAQNASPAKSKHPRSSSEAIIRVAMHFPPWIFTLQRFVEYGIVLFFILQFPITFAAVRLEFELHWYIVTDRSLRIRTGLFKVTESTMSFANLQQVEIKQGPLQRLLRLADVRVQSAGGGGDHHKSEKEESLHTGVFQGVDNAAEIRDLILDRLRRFREAGLGDPDDHSPVPGKPTAPVPAGEALTAARELLAEARAMREALR